MELEERRMQLLYQDQLKKKMEIESVKRRKAEELKAKIERVRV